MTRALLWFRRDLRLGDHPALAAAADSEEVLACFVVDPRLEASAGLRRLQFLGDSLRQLNDALQGRLLVTRDRPEQRIPLIAKAIDASSVHVTGDFAPFGRRRDERVAAGLGRVPLVATGSPYLVSPGRVVKNDGSPYQVFTPFFHKWQDARWRAPAGTGPGSACWLDPAQTDIEQCEIPDPGTELDLAAGEAAAIREWTAFRTAKLDRYEHDRDRPDIEGTSRMSAHLKFGTIHPRTMVAGMDLTGTGARSYLRELAFRDFYGAVLHHWPASAWHNWNSNFDGIVTDTDADARRLFECWKAGETGYPLVDAGMRQLRETGFMHNRVRMIAASFLVKDLHLPWQWGAAWFLDQLTDGDLASNQHGWQWSAGCGTDAAPYFRIFNPSAQAEKFDPAGDYIRRWVPELRDVDNVHRIQRRGGPCPSTYPAPIVDHGTERAEALRRYHDIG
ncbi:Deoxyribodipyrimidine photo-lyase [Mycobacterium marinum]|uniref:cryptochrome/photolyase family protein n=1 Tax=Mycobacterium marinum TaxID=1781 RepID=UPI000E3E63F6|nr:deoxyribodipyrimidine photo-lyase [Mycobacterium marinum]RFZ02593.1 Deoxyribodipyrimidine photo-lyase [Mycobacterium marinum]